MPYSGNDFTARNPGELVSLAFDFGCFMNTAQGETLLTGVWTCTLLQGVDPSPSSRLQGGSAISGTECVQFFTAVGFTPDPNGNLYLLECTATTSLSQILVLYSHIGIIIPS